MTLLVEQEKQMTKMTAKMTTGQATASVTKDDPKCKSVARKHTLEDPENAGMIQKIPKVLHMVQGFESQE